MPIYEYECTKCGHKTELLQKFSDPPLSECGKCHGKMKKLMSQNSFHLKGSGWYVTDYASKRSGYQSKSEKSNNSSSTGEAKSSTDKPKKEATSESPKSAKD